MQIYRAGVSLLAALTLAMAVSTRAEAAVNVVSFGAVPNDAGDDTAAFSAALASVPAGQPVQIYAPAGVYLLSSPITVTDRAATFQGDGQRVTVLKWTSATDGIVYVSNVNTIDHALSVRSLSLLTTSSGVASRAAIRASWPAVQNFHGELGFVTANISDVHIAGASSGPNVGADFWTCGVCASNVTGAKVSQFSIAGNSISSRPNYTAAIGFFSAAGP